MPDHERSVVMSDNDHQDDQNAERDAEQNDHQDSQADDQKTERDKTLSRLSDERKQARERAQAAEKRVAELEAKQREADEAKAKEDGKFKELLDQREKELADLKAQIADRDLSDLKRTIAKDEGLPGDLALRLAGDDEDALRKDAKALAKHLKAQDAPDTDAGERTPRGTKKPDKSEFSNPARWGLRTT